MWQSRKCQLNHRSEFTRQPRLKTEQAPLWNLGWGFCLFRAADKSVSCRRMSLPTCHCTLGAPHLSCPYLCPLFLGPRPPRRPVCCGSFVRFHALGSEHGARTVPVETWPSQLAMVSWAGETSGSKGRELALPWHCRAAHVTALLLLAAYTLAEQGLGSGCTVQLARC